MQYRFFAKFGEIDPTKESDIFFNVSDSKKKPLAANEQVVEAVEDVKNRKDKSVSLSLQRKDKRSFTTGFNPIKEIKF